MSSQHTSGCIAFIGPQLLARGSVDTVARAAKNALDHGTEQPLLVFDAHDSRPLDFDLHGSLDDVLARLAPAPESGAARGPGRPKLGVVPREVTLLPRHWEWLGRQSGGASAVLRRLVEQAQRGNDAQERTRQAMESADRFMRAMAGDEPGYEEASRALYRGERERFGQLTAGWPTDVRAHLLRLAEPAWAPPVT